MGFIIAIILSWIFDIHPEGGIVKTESAKKVTEEPASPSANSWKIASYISFVVIVGLIVLNIFGKQGEVRIDKSLAKSIAVLPFHNISGDDEQEYICIGLTDEIISHLFKVRSFDEVRSLTSILPFKDSEQSIKEIARQLQVNYVLEGSYKRMGDELKITAQLIEPGSDNHIWVQDYELSYSEIPGIPGEIALQIANHIKTFISEDEQKRVKRISTTNQEAYELFQQVNYYFISRNLSSLPIEETLFKVIELDPEYADAYAFMGFVALLGVGYAADTSGTSQLTVYDALPYVNKALELDPDNAVSCMVLGLYNLWVKWDFPEAEKNFLKATNLEPNNTFNKISLTTLYLSMERMEELESLIPSIEEESDSDHSLPGSIEYFIGLYYSGTGYEDSAFYWLEKAHNRRSAEMYWLRVNPVLDNIRDDPRYWDLYERTGHTAYDDYMASKNN